MTKPKDPKKKLTKAQRSRSFKERWKVRKLNEEKVKLALADEEADRKLNGHPPMTQAVRKIFAENVRKGFYAPIPGGQYAAKFGPSGVATGKLESMEPTSPGSGRLGNVTAPQNTGPVPVAGGFPSVRTPSNIARGAAMLNRRTTDTQPDESRAERISRTEGLIDTIQTLQDNHELDEVLVGIRARVFQILDGMPCYSSNAENMDGLIVKLGGAIRFARRIGTGWGAGRSMPPFDPIANAVDEETARK